MHRLLSMEIRGRCSNFSYLVTELYGEAKVLSPNLTKKNFKEKLINYLKVTDELDEDLIQAKYYYYDDLSSLQRDIHFIINCKIQ